MSSTKKRLLILASGRGTNFEALYRGVEQSRIPDAEIVGVVCNQEKARVLELAKHFGVPAFLVESKGRSKADYERELLARMQELKPDLVLLAGYMKILGNKIIRAFENRMLNIHPSLLPQFRGLDAQKQALEAGVPETGCTVHWVTEGLDEGPNVLQATMKILPNDTVESLSNRLLSLEHETYVQAVAKIIKGS